MSISRTGIFVLILLCSVSVGYGGGDKKLKVYPVSGQLLYNDEPLRRVLVAFHPVDGKNVVPYPAYAETDDEGKFSLTTYIKGDGAPAGDYKVAVAFEPKAVEDGGDQTVKLKFQVPVEYHKAETTDLTAKIDPSPNALAPFKLSGPPMPAKR